MRFHHEYPLLQLWASSPQSVGVMRPESLAIGRLEPTVCGGVVGAGVLDLLFFDGTNVAVLPYVKIEPNFLIERERTPLVWPQAAAGFSFEQLDALETLLIPWLDSLTLARQWNEEVVRTFSTASVEPMFEEARAAGFLGAACYSELLVPFARYAYAARFSKGRDVRIEDPNGANGAAMLASRSRSVRADLMSPERNALARRWFGMQIFGAADSAAHLTISQSAISIANSGSAVHAVQVASPVPSDVMISFDLEDAPPAASFDVCADIEIPMRCPSAVAIPVAAGGSSGRILMVLREDFARAADADVDEARTLAELLRREGFGVELTTPSLLSEQSSADLVHVFGVTRDAALLRGLTMFRERGVPIVANTQLVPGVNEAEWGPRVLQAVFMRETDEARLAEYLDLLEMRKVTANVKEPAHSLESVLPLIDAAIVNSSAEAEHARGVLPFGAEVVEAPAAFYAWSAGPEAVAPLVGDQPFVLVHSPVEWRTNLPLLVRATAARGIPVVVAGPTIDLDALRAAQRYAPELLIHLPMATEGQIEALYRAARVYADVSWAPRGQARIARAAASGCRLLLSNSAAQLDLWPTAARADAASIAALGDALERAWNAPLPATQLDVPSAFSATISAYARAPQRRLPA